MKVVYKVLLLLALIFSGWKTEYGNSNHLLPRVIWKLRYVMQVKSN